jgi:hypothetical protein
MRKLFLLLLFLGVASSAFAVGVTTSWKGTTGSTDWFNAANWGAGVPTNEAGNSTTLYGSTSQANGPIIVDGDAVALAVRDGGAGGPGGTTSHLTIQSGTLTVGDFLLVAPDSTTAGGRNGALHVEGGTIELTTGQGMLGIGNGADGNPTGSQNITGTLYMSDGLINAKYLKIGGNLTKGIAYISGGTIDLNRVGGDFQMRPNPLNPNAPELHMSGTGQIIVIGDLSARIQGYIANGWITGATYDYNITNAGATTIYVPEPATVCLLGLGALSLIRRRK